MSHRIEKHQGEVPQNTSKLLELPSTLAESIACVQDFIFKRFDQEIKQKQLFYHNREHIKGVKHRSYLILEAISPYLLASGITTSNEIERNQLLLDLCAVSHDAIQVFIPQTVPHTSRKREEGVSERLTIQMILDYIQTLNREWYQQGINESLLFKQTDLFIIQEAIEATICLYDPIEQSIYQPSLYERSQPLSIVARILALADIGTLGIEGIEAYNHEGLFLFLEENPDIIPLVLEDKMGNLRTENPELYENIRQRLLRRTRFQINFAKSRLKRFPQEIAGFPETVISVLQQDVFKYLNQETIQAIEKITPIHEQTSLEELIVFFGLNQELKLC